MSAPPTVQIIGRGRTKRLVVAFHEDARTLAPTQETVLRVGDQVLLRGNPLQGSRPWSRPRIGTIDALYKGSWIRFLVPRYRWLVGVPIWEFFRWVDIRPEATPVPEPQRPCRSVYDWLRSDWLHIGGDAS